MRRAIRTLREAWRTWNTNWPAEEVRRALVIQSGSPRLFLDILRSVQRRFDGAEISVAVHEDGLSHLHRGYAQRVFLIERRDKIDFIRRMRRNGYDTVVICATGERGFWKLKLMAFCLGARQVLCYNEHCGGFVCNRWHWMAAPRHLAYRLSHPSPAAQSGRPETWRRALDLPMKAAALSLWMARAMTWEARRFLNTGMGCSSRE